MRFLKLLAKGGRCGVAAVAVCRKGSLRVAGRVPLAFGGLKRAPVVALDSPSTFAMVGDSPKSLRGKIGDAAFLLAAEDLLSHC